MAALAAALGLPKRLCAHVTGSSSLLGVGVRRIVGVAAADVLFFRVGLLVFFVVSAFFVFFLAAAPGSGFFLSFFSLCWPLTFVNPSVRNDDASSVPGCFSSTWSTSFFLSTNPLVRATYLHPLTVHKCLWRRSGWVPGDAEDLDAPAAPPRLPVRALGFVAGISLDTPFTRTSPRAPPACCTVTFTPPVGVCSMLKLRPWGPMVTGPLVLGRAD